VDKNVIYSTFSTQFFLIYFINHLFLDDGYKLTYIGYDYLALYVLIMKYYIIYLIFFYLLVELKFLFSVIHFLLGFYEKRIYLKCKIKNWSG